MNVLSFTAALLALVAHVLVAVSMATNFWLVFRTGNSVPFNVVQPKLNPLLNNTELDIEVSYRATHLGVWTACFEENNYGGKISCGLIDGGCSARVCWRRNITRKSCKRHKVAALTTERSQCAAFQATRALAVLGVFFSILATTLLFVSLCVMARLFAAIGAVCALASAAILLIAFAVFQALIINATFMNTVAHRGFSFVLLIAAWVIAVFAGLIGCLGAFGGGSKGDAGAD